MKKHLLTSAIVLAFASSGAYAHHPAADIVDPEIYEMISENVSDAHAAMIFYDMGRYLLMSAMQWNPVEKADGEIIF